ncbi:MarR family transcriptional regulator [Alteromonas gracilis]
MVVPTVTARTELASELRVSVARFVRRVRKERGSDDEITLTQRSVLVTLWRDGEQPVGRLAEAEQVRPPSMTRTVACLEEGGYVTRRQDPDDGRAVLVHLTDKGNEVLEADRRRRDAWLSQRLAELTEDERRVLRDAVPLLERMARHR